MNEASIFAAALDRATDEERVAYLADACAGNEKLRRRLEGLLHAHAQPDSILDSPAGGRPTATYKPVSERPGTVVGPYKLLQKIGEGGFGVVYMAEQTKPVQRTVALKIIKPGMDTAQVIARFESERQALALMDHPNIARVLDAGATDSGRPYFVMELVKGVPITEFCDKNRLPAVQRLKLFVDVCHAIQHAHHKGVIHRDIKPSNVMITLHDGLPVVKVIDFGVAKAIVQKLTEKTLFTAYGEMVGTPAYMSPEQAEMSGLDIDTRSDIFSMGVLLYELLTGTTPLSVKQLREAGYAGVQRMIREENVPRPSTRLSSLGGQATILAANRSTDSKQLARLLAGDLDWIVMKALEKDRNRRYSTPGDFAEDVERYLSHEAILARPPSLGYKLKKFAERNRAAAVTAVVVLAALTGGGVAATLGLAAANRAEQKAASDRDRATRERDSAIAARKETFDALTDLTNSTVGDLLAEKKDASPEARIFFDRVVKRYERLAAAMPDIAESDFLRATCLKAVGDAYRYLGSHEQALKAYGQSADLCLAIQARTPANAATAGMLVSCMARIQLTRLDLGRGSDVKAVIDQQVALAEKLHGSFPDNSEVARELARLYVIRRTVQPDWYYRTSGAYIIFVPSADAPTAFIDVDRAVALLEPEVARDGTGRDILADALRLRIKDLGMSQQVKRASADVERVGKLAEKYKDFNLQFKWCQCLLDYVDASADSHVESQDALPQIQLAASNLERMEPAYLGSEAVRQELHRSYVHLRAALKGKGREGEAEMYLQRDLALMARDSEAQVGGQRYSVAAPNAAQPSYATAAKDELEAGQKAKASQSLDLAVRELRRTLELLQQAPNVGAFDHSSLTEVARECGLIGEVAEKLGRWPDAVEFDRRELELIQPFSQPNPKTGRIDWKVSELIMSGKLSLTRAYIGAGQLALAHATWEELLQLESFSISLPEHDDTCGAISELGAKLASLGQPVEIDLVLAPGLAERRKRFAEQPKDQIVRDELRQAYRTLGRIHENAHAYSEALKAFDEALALNLYPNWEISSADGTSYGQILAGRAICLEALGRADDGELAFKTLRAFGGRFSLPTLPVELVDQHHPQQAVRLLEELSTAKNLVHANERWSWSPDGKRMAIISRATNRLGILDIASGQVADCIRDAHDPAWSPGDGHWIAISRRPRDLPEEIWIISAQASEPRKLCAGGYPSWSADGKSVYCFSQKRKKIVAVPIEPVNAPTKDLCDMQYPYPAISSDGSLVAYSEGGNLRVMETKTGKTVRSFALKGWKGFLGAWSPDGRQLSYGSTGGENSVGLWLLDVPSGRRFKIMDGPCTMPGWTNDGKKFAFQVRYDGSVWMIDQEALADLGEHFQTVQVPQNDD